MSVIHVNSHIIRKNVKNKTKEPAIVIRRTRSDDKPVYASAVAILDKDGNVVAEIGSHYDRPLKCGAVIYIKCLYGTKVLEEAANGAGISCGSSGEAHQVACEAA